MNSSDMVYGMDDAVIFSLFSYMMIAAIHDMINIIMIILLLQC